MKIYCESCGASIHKDVRKKFDQFSVGKIKCPHCNKKNKRYISEFDLMLNFLLTSLVYSVALISTISVYTFMFNGDNLLSIAPLILAILIGAYYLVNIITISVYKYGFLKEEWKNRVFNEDHDKVFKRMQYNFVLFVAVSLIVGTQLEMFTMFLAMYFAIFGVTAIKAHIVWKSEYMDFLDIKSKS